MTLMVAAVIFVIGAPIMFITIAWANSPSRHEKYHTHHSELMCDGCRKRWAQSSSTENANRWPMRIMGENPPTGTG